MPWQEVLPMDLRRQFVHDVLRGVAPFVELCRAYGISRRTGYKWLRRFEAEGLAGLRDRSRRPHTCPHAVAPAVVTALLEARQRHPSWGPRKLLALVRQRAPATAWPARSSVARLLGRYGLSAPRRHRRQLGHPGRPLTPLLAPNAVWTADFKGQFRTGDGAYCYPLTVADGYSRYLLACAALTGTTVAESRPVFEHLFRTYGLPEQIRTDNGVPFATSALGRLSALSVWWVRLGIRPELIEPARPYQNGRHERMHLTLKRETTRPPQASRHRQQRRFDAFCAEFNHERPHEALADATPASVYQPSVRPYPARLPPLEYPRHFEVRRVSRNGGIRWHHRWVNVSHVLGEEVVGLTEIDDGEWDLYFGPLRLGRFHERTLKIEDVHGRAHRKRVLPMS